MDWTNYFWIFFVTVALPIVKATGCSRELLGANGTFSSPNFPSNYPTNTVCVWRVNLTRGAILNIRFEQFSTESCCDFVIIRTGLRTTEIRGDRGSFSFLPIIAANDTVIEIEFRSDSTVTERGFSAYYSVSPPPTTLVPTTPTTTTPPTTGPPFLGCGGTLYESAGNFGTPGFPGPYGNNLNCTWTFYIPIDGYIWLHFRVFQTETCCDYVDLISSTGQILQRYIGTRSPFNHKVFGNTTLTLRVRFTSDSSVRRSGFLASYTVTSPLKASPVPSVSSSSLTTELPTTTSIPFTTTPLTIAPSTQSLAQTTSSSVVPPGPVTLPPDLQRIFVNVLQSLRGIIDQIGRLLTGPISSGDIENFRNATLQILQQVQNQIAAPSPTNTDNLVKRAIPEFPNLWEFIELLDKLQRRLN